MLFRYSYNPNSGHIQKSDNLAYNIWTVKITRLISLAKAVWVLDHFVQYWYGVQAMASISNIQQLNRLFCILLLYVIQYIFGFPLSWPEKRTTKILLFRGIQYLKVYYLDPSYLYTSYSPGTRISFCLSQVVFNQISNMNGQAKFGQLFSVNFNLHLGAVTALDNVHVACDTDDNAFRHSWRWCAFDNDFESSGGILFVDGEF